MKTYVLFPDRAASPENLRRVGGKAGALAMLQGAGFRIPEWFVVLPDAFEDSLTAAQRSAMTVANVRRTAEGVACAPEFACEVERALEALGGADAALAVRSSAADEDREQHSFAGQLDSFLSVAPGQVISKITAVWQSAFSDRVLAYRRRHGLQLVPPPPAVVVQKMVNVAMSGVAFSADPVSGRRSISVVSAVCGLGTALVSGAADADTYQISAAGVALRSSTAVPRVLSDSEALEIAGLARAAERFFGRPQDIEWAIDGEGELWLLQSRPITVLSDLPDPDGVRLLWDNSNIAESYPGLSSPLTFSFARRAYEEVYHQFCRVMGVPSSTIGQHSSLFRNMLGYVRGRIYYNLLNWYRVLALLPGFQVNRRFMETMMGVRQGLPAEIVDEISHITSPNRIRDALRLVATTFGLLWNFARLERGSADFCRRVDEALGPSRPDFSAWHPEELVAHYRDLEHRLLCEWRAPIVNDFFAMVFHGLLKRLCASWCAAEGDALQNELLSARGGMISAEPAAYIRAMAAHAADDLELREALSNGSLRDIRRVLETRPAFAALYRKYLETFGDRCTEELKLESVTLHDDPLPLLRTVGSMASRSIVAQLPDTGAVGAAEEMVARAVAGHPFRRVVFQWALRNARLRIRSRENMRLDRTRVFGRVRQVFLEIGKRLYALDRLDDPRDVFYLAVEEVLGFVEGTATSTDLRGLAALRRAEMEKWKSASPPPGRFETRGPVGHSRFIESATVAQHPSDEVRKGFGCCPGVVRAPIRFVRDPKTAELHGTEVLLAERTDPGWITLFPLASGLIVERGSVLSHSAIVARELGLPTVVSLSGATTWLHDGDLVELNGSTGEVRKIEAAHACA